MPDEISTFPIPASIQDLERDPYNLLPYPHDFEDGDEAARADSFARLVGLIDQGNQTLISGGLYLFDQRQRSQGEDPWMDEDRVQALYTLVRYVNYMSKTQKEHVFKSCCRNKYQNLSHTKLFVQYTYCNCFHVRNSTLWCLTIENRLHCQTPHAGI
jgi:hypothetical protein